MSATTIVDLGNSVTFFPSVSPDAGVASTPASGVIIGGVMDMLHVNNLTNVIVGFGPSTSGQFKVQVQTSDATTSGSFTDPTSGLAVMPTNMLSGGIYVVNSGNSARSGGFDSVGFLRPHRYARVNVMSGDLFNAPVTVGALAGRKRTGSGDGYSFSPGSGTVGGF
jgi:hypothetical protein